MSPVLDVRTVVFIYAGINIGQAVVLIICGVFEETREAQTAYAFSARNVGRPYARYRTEDLRLSS